MAGRRGVEEVADDIVTTVAAHGLPGDLGTFPSAPLDDATWSVVALSSFERKLSGLLLDVVEDELLPVTSSQADHAAALAATWFERTSVVNTSLLRANDVLEGRGVDRRILKGLGTAIRLYGDTLRRPYSDVDILVPEDRFGEALESLCRSGWARKEPGRRRRFDQRFAHAVALWDGQAEVDLHRMVVHPPAGDLLPSDVVFGRPGDQVELSGVDIPVLTAPDALMHAVAHGLFDHFASPTLLGARDLIEWAVRVPREDQLAAAQEWHLGALPQFALDRARARLRLDDAPLPLEVDFGEWEQRLLHLSDGDARLTRLRSLPGARDRIAYAVGMAFPSRAYLSATGQSRRTRAHEVLRHVRHGARSLQ